MDKIADWTKRSKCETELKGRRFITHFESAIEPGVTLPTDQVQMMHEGRPLFARYDLDAVKHAMSKSHLANRPRDMWRYRELLPIGTAIEPVTMGKSMSPIIACPRLASRFNLKNVWIKDESQLPTCSFKSRGLSLAITMAKYFCLLYTSPSPRDQRGSRMPSSA